ncbi:MAG: SoxR reducing system RseC family protein [Desulfosudaceae bacterium]
MATEEGLVLRASETTAWIKTTRSTACEHCHSKDSCKTLGGANDMQVEAANPVGAKEGDQVVIDFNTGSLLKGTFLIYIFPILCLLAGAAIGVKISEATGQDRSLVSAICGFGALVLSMFFVRFQGNRLSRKDAYKPRIIRIKHRLP